MAASAQSPAANNPEKYLPFLKGKTVGLVVNQSSLVDTIHLVDFLLENKIDVKKIFAPEHGFRGKQDRGAKVNNSSDSKTGLPIVSLHGKHKKPQTKDLKGIDVLLFDIQDVGVRFFTYISTMHYAMEAAAENNLAFVVLDRPNPLGDYIAGPIRKEKYKSFVGMHPIPIVHGLTVAELAQMIRGERWINNAENLQLKVFSCENYTHKSHYSLPIKPSPNLPNMLAIRLYPSLCFFEATKVSIGRGTHEPFQQIGFPDPKFGSHTFIPKDIKGMQVNPIQEGKLCYGIELCTLDPWQQRFSLKYWLQFFNQFEQKDMVTRKAWFNLLVGNGKLYQQLQLNKTEEEILHSWKAELDTYKLMRRKYLLYEDFE